MIALLIVTHGQLGEALLGSAAMICGQSEGARALSFLPGQGVEDLEAAVRAALAQLSAPEGVLCLVDLPGGSPARVAASVMAEGQPLEVVAGVNLPMVAEVLLLRQNMTLRDLARHAAVTGAESVVNIGDLLRSQTA